MTLTARRPLSTVFSAVYREMLGVVVEGRRRPGGGVVASFTGRRKFGGGMRRIGCGVVIT